MIQISKISATAFFCFRLPLRASVFDPMVVFDWLFLAQTLQYPAFCMKKIKKSLGHLENGQNFFFFIPAEFWRFLIILKQKKSTKKNQKNMCFTTRIGRFGGWATQRPAL